MPGSVLTRACAVLLLSTPLAACDATEPQRLSEVLISRGDVSEAASLAPALLAESAAAGVPLSAVTSIDVVITGVELLPAGGDADDAADWIALDLVDGAVAELDLLALPLQGGVPIAVAELEEGETFQGLRIFFQEPATITFDETVSVGPTVLEPGTYPLFIPSGTQAGIRVFDAFTIERVGDDVVVDFDADASVRQIVVAGATGRILMPPVLGVAENE